MLWTACQCLTLKQLLRHSLLTLVQWLPQCANSSQAHSFHSLWTKPTHLQSWLTSAAFHQWALVVFRVSALALTFVTPTQRTTVAFVRLKHLRVRTLGSCSTLPHTHVLTN